MRTTFFSLLLLLCSIAVPAQNLELFRDSASGLFGYKNKSTHAIVISAQYKNAGSFAEGLAPVAQLVDYSERWGFIDATGKLVIPLKYENEYLFSEGLAGVSDENGKWGFIDKTGKVIIPLTYDEVDVFDEGKAQVKLGDKEFYINKSNKKVAAPKDAD